MHTERFVAAGRFLDLLDAGNSLGEGSERSVALFRGAFGGNLAVPLVGSLEAFFEANGRLVPKQFTRRGDIRLRVANVALASGFVFRGQLLGGKPAEYL